MSRQILGIDIGGSGIKANIVDPAAGSVLADRHKIATPRPATPETVTDATAETVRWPRWTGPVGCAFPAVVRRGVALTAANIDPAWIGVDVAARFGAATGLEVTVVNDADAAGIAEAAHGAARDCRGVAIVLTFGTGIGSAVLVDGTLVPNTELGHLEFGGHAPVEDWAAARVRKEEGLSWGEWADRVDRFLHHLDRLFSPDRFVVGGGVSRRWERFGSRFTVAVETVAAAFGNQAGIVGAAVAAASAR